MNCHLTAENAAFTKIRQLEKRVDETDKELDDVKQQVSANTNAFNGHIAQTAERVETKELSATSATANTATFTNAEAGNLNATGITATTIDAGTINVDNLENVNVLHGKTVDVDKTIATIGQFTETHTTTANNTTTNTDTLNVSTEANLTGQVNIDGNLTFTKDNGLSKLQGNYLEVDAANVVIENKNKEAYALKVPGINGQALFGGSVTVQDTLTAKNLVVDGETHTTTANNTTTNTDTLNVSTEANLTGQVNIDGNLTFTKDNGLSKLQGEYLEVDAAKVVLNNKTKDGYALYAPGVDGRALFEGSVSVQDTLTAKNLVVDGEVKGLKLDEDTVLTNPTFKGITGTNELTTTALVINSEGKLVSKKVSNEVEGSVASSLVAYKKIINATLLNEWKQNSDNSVYKVPVSSTAQFVINTTNGEIQLTNENGNQRKVSDLGVTLEEAAYSVVHNNFVYIIHPTMENGTTFKCVIIPINTNTMEVSPSLDITQYFGEVSSSDYSESIFEVVQNKATYQPAAFGSVLSEDVPTIGFIGTNTYINLSTMEVNTRDTAFDGKYSYVLTKNGRWIKIFGSVFSGMNTYYCTNGRYSSVEDAALGVPTCENILDPDTNKISRQMFYVDAPLFGMCGNSLVYSNGGKIKEKPFAYIPGYSTYESHIFGTVDKDGNPVYFGTLLTVVSNSASNSNLYLMGGYYPRDYFTTTTSYIETIVIDDAKVEVNGSTFVDGVWYDKVVNSVTDLIAFITKPKDKKRYKVLYTGYSVWFDSSDTFQFPKVFTSNDIYGTFDIYHRRDDSRTFALELIGTPGTATRISTLIDACHWHGFNTNVSLLFCNEALNKILAVDDESVSYLHINDCQLTFGTSNTGKNSKYYLGISDSSNVTYGLFNIPGSLFSDVENKKVDLTLTNCYNVIYRDNNSANDVMYGYSKMLFSFSDRCEANIYSIPSQVSEQCGPGYNLEYNAAANAGAKFRTPTLKYRATPYR